MPLSKCTILGAAIGNYVSISGAKHPGADRPIIDYEVSTLMQAGELLGVTLGVLLNLLLPEVVIMIFLACLLSYNAYKTLMKGRAKYRAETAAFARQAKRQLELASGGGGGGGGNGECLKLVSLANAPKGARPSTSPRQQSAAELARAHAAQMALVAASAAELGNLLAAAGCGGLADGLAAYGVDSVRDLEDPLLCSDAQLTHEVRVHTLQVGRGGDDCVSLWTCDGCRQMRRSPSAVGCR